MLGTIASHYVASTAPGTYSAAVLADNPWGFWQFAETSGTALADSSPNGRTANIITGAPTLAQPGPRSTVQSISWPTNSYAQSTATLAEPAVNTHEVWVYLSALPTQVTPILFVAPTGGSSGPTSGIQIQTDGRVESRLYTDRVANISSSNPLALNTWNHVVTSTGAAGSKIRVNKATVASSGTTSVLNAGTGPVWIHAYYNGAGIVNGGPVQIAAPALYLTQLSDARTDAHYDAMVA